MNAETVDSAAPVGVYVLANDAVSAWLSAFVTSFRIYNPELSLSLIPFNDDSARCEDIVAEAGGCTYRNPDHFAELERIGRVLELGHSSYGPFWFRRYAAFAGPYERFAYLDCRMVILADLLPFIGATRSFDVPLVHYDTAINQVYNDGEIRISLCRNGFGHGFLSGMWASHRGLFTLEQMTTTADRLLVVRGQMNNRNTDQFFINYLCDSFGIRACHMADLDSRYAHCAWAGDRGGLYESPDGSWRRWDFGGLQHKRRMPFVHWAGFRLHPSMPHYTLHQRFRRYDVGMLGRLREAIVRPLGRLARTLRGNRWLNTLYHARVRRADRNVCL
jgi:hypothetical protein